MLPSTPDRDARTPTLTGPDCANDGTPASELAASAPPEIFRKSLRFRTDIGSLPIDPCYFQHRARSRGALRLHFGGLEPLFRGLLTPRTVNHPEILQNGGEFCLLFGFELADRATRLAYRTPHHLQRAVNNADI